MVQIVNKEGSFEMGIEANSGALQAASDPGCWRWFGNMRLTMHEWSMAAVSFDGKLQRNFVNGIEAEQAVCKGPIAQTRLENSLRIGARGGQHCCGASRKACCHLGVKHKADAVSHKGSWAQFVGDVSDAVISACASLLLPRFLLSAKHMIHLVLTMLQIDEVMLYSTALKPGEMADIYQGKYRTGSVALPVTGKADISALKQNTGVKGGKMLVG